MRVRELIDPFKLKVAAGERGIDRDVTSGYCGDLLSEVMAHAPKGCVWLTVQGHQNIIAVAVLREMAAIVLAGERLPDEETVLKADQEAIPVLLWPHSAYELCGRLYSMGLKGEDGV